MIRMMRTAGTLRVAAAIALGLALSACSGAPTETLPGSVNNSTTGNSTSGSTAPSDALAFSAADYSTAQSLGSVSVTVTRVGTTTAAASVNYATADGTAAA